MDVHITNRLIVHIYLPQIIATWTDEPGTGITTPPSNSYQLPLYN